jgi:hypothetical protein
MQQLVESRQLVSKRQHYDEDEGEEKEEEDEVFVRCT